MSGHLGFEELAELVAEEAVSTEWVERMLHLRLCAECRQQMRELYPALAPKLVERLFPGLRSATPDIDGPRSPAWRDLGLSRSPQIQVALERERELAREDEDAAKLWLRFRDLEDSRWALLVGNHRGVQTFGMIRLLLRRSRAFWRSDPNRAETLTRWALAIFPRLDAGRYNRLQAAQAHCLAWGYLANSLRAQGRLDEADKALRTAEAGLPEEFSVLEKAWLCRFRSSLKRDQRCFSEALQAAGRARRLFGQIRSPEVAWATLQEAYVLAECGKPEESESLVRGLLERDRQEPLLSEVSFLAIQHLTVTLVTLGRGMEAHSWLQKLEDRAGEFQEPLSQARLMWTRGRVFDALGGWRRAADWYWRARQVFLDWEIAYDVALVSLDLAAVELELGHAGEAAQLAAEMLPILKSLEIERESLAALRLLAESLRQQEATAAAVREAAGRLRCPGRTTL